MTHSEYGPPMGRQALLRLAADLLRKAAARLEKESVEGQFGGMDFPLAMEMFSQAGKYLEQSKLARWKNTRSSCG